MTVFYLILAAFCAIGLIVFIVHRAKKAKPQSKPKYTIGGGSRHNFNYNGDGREESDGDQGDEETDDKDVN